MEDPIIKSDHDLLIAVHENLKTAIDNISKLSAKVDEFNNNYIKKQEIDPILKDHESRIRRLELIGAIAVGMLYLLQFISQFIPQIKL